MTGMVSMASDIVFPQQCGLCLPVRITYLIRNTMPSIPRGPVERLHFTLIHLLRRCLTMQSRIALNWRPSCLSLPAAGLGGGGASPSHLVFVDCVFFVVSMDVGKTKTEGLLSTGTLATVDAVAFLSLFP